MAPLSASFMLDVQAAPGARWERAQLVAAETTVGAWGTGSFDNDDAMDWVGELADGGFDSVNAALEGAIGGSDRLDLPSACVARAAAEVVAALRGRPAPQLPEQVTEWLPLGRRVRLSAELPDKARSALKRVRDNSEERELWDESGDGQQWLATVDELIARLS